MWRSKKDDSQESDVRRLIEEIQAERERLRQDGHAGSGQEVPNDEPAPHVEPQPRLASVSRQVQSQALDQMRTALDQFQRGVDRTGPARGHWADTDELMDLKRRLLQLCQRVEDVLNDIAREVGRLADEAARLAWREAVADVRRDAAAAIPHVPADAAVRQEPRFEPARQPLVVAFAGVPDFEALLEAQSALDVLPPVRAASVSEFEREDALLDVLLQAPATVRDIVEGLCGGTGRQFLIEEADMVARRLRLRFIEKESRRFRDDSILRPERWPKG